MNISPQQATAITAAVRRVFAGMTEHEQSIEIAWSYFQVTVDERGYIHWRLMKLGKLLLIALSEAQNWRCCYCGVRVSDISERKPTLEHVIPKRKKGSDHPDNLVMACLTCNYAASHIEHIEFS